MACDDAFVVSIFALAVTRGHHREIASVGGLKHVKEVLWTVKLAMLVALRWHAHDV